MPKSLEDKVDKLSENINNLAIKLETHLTEFNIYKKFVTKVGYAILVGLGGILLKLFWQYISKTPAIIANVIAALKL